MIMGYHASLSCHLGWFSRTYQNLNHHSLLSSSKSSLHSRYFHVWIWSLHLRIPKFLILEELHVTPRTTSIFANKHHKQYHPPIQKGSVSHHFTILSHDLSMTFPHTTIYFQDFPALKMSSTCDWFQVLIPSPSSTSISTSNVPWGDLRQLR